jgi:hypothetical protein
VLFVLIALSIALVVAAWQTPIFWYGLIVSLVTVASLTAMIRKGEVNQSDEDSEESLSPSLLGTIGGIGMCAVLVLIIATIFHRAFT